MSNELKPLHFDADYTMEEALAEAKRCLNCPKPLCRMYRRLYSDAQSHYLPFSMYRRELHRLSIDPD